MIKINYNDINKFNFDFDIKVLSKRLLKKILEIENISYDISINLSIVSLGKIKKINKEYRGINNSTDVLSFPNIDFKRPSSFSKFINNGVYDVSIIDLNSKTIFLGDIVICFQKVISQSKNYNHSTKREFSFLFVHSVLHLLGYDHENEKQEKIMFAKQELVLDSLKIYR